MLTSLARSVNVYIFFVGEKGNEMKSIQGLSPKSYSLLPKEGSETDSACQRPQTPTALQLRRRFIISPLGSTKSVATLMNSWQFLNQNPRSFSTTVFFLYLSSFILLWLFRFFSFGLFAGTKEQWFKELTLDFVKLLWAQCKTVFPQVYKYISWRTSIA